MHALVLLLVTVFLSSCVSSIEPDIQLNPSPREDQAYMQVFERVSKSRVVFKNFETRYEISATYLSPEFRAAFSDRLARIFREAPIHFEEASEKSGFFVSIGAPDDDHIDLTNPHHWSIFLSASNGTPIKPILVKRLDDKERWRAFFDHVTDWTREYLIVFDTPSVNANSKDLVAKTTINLMFANADAQLSLNW